VDGYPQGFLVKEKEATKQRDALNAEHRELPMVVQIDNQYEFDGPDGKASLLDLFERRKQLNVHHFTFHPDWDAKRLGTNPRAAPSQAEVTRRLCRLTLREDHHLCPST